MLAYTLNHFAFILLTFLTDFEPLEPVKNSISEQYQLDQFQYNDSEYLEDIGQPPVIDRESKIYIIGLLIILVWNY